MDLQQLIQKDLGFKECLNNLLDAPEGQIASFLTYTAIRPWSVDNVMACADFMLKKATTIDLPDGIDLVGTGGDGHSTINVSTISSLIAASLGVKMAKHGNRSSSSKCGSADFLEALGYDLLKPEQDIINEYSSHNFAFLYAPSFHPAMKKLKSIRKELGFPTIFNIMGPLTNPSRPRKAVIGVAKYEWGHVMAESLQKANYKKAMIVCGAESLDEISPCGKTHVWYLENDKINYDELHPSHFDLNTHSLVDIKGGDAAHNLKLFNQLLDNCDAVPAIRDVLCMNVAALLWVSDDIPLKQGVQTTLKHIKSGKFKEWLTDFIK